MWENKFKVQTSAGKVILASSRTVKELLKRGTTINSEQQNLKEVKTANLKNSAQAER
jgi:hypothetical protein